MQNRRLLPSLALFAACSRPQTAPTDADRDAAPSEGSVETPLRPATALPDCAGVDTAEPTLADALPILANARREAANKHIFARVGDVELPRGALDAALALKFEIYTSRGREPPQSSADRYTELIAGRLVWNEIVRQEAAARGVELDERLLDRRAAELRLGVPDYPEHLRRRRETEDTIREMNLADLRATALIEAETDFEVDERALTSLYCRSRDKWDQDSEYRVISWLTLTSAGDGDRARAALRRGTDIGTIATQNPALPFVQRQLVAKADNEFYRAVFEAPLGEGRFVEIGSTTYLVVVEEVVEPGTLSRELLFEELRTQLRKVEMSKRRVEQRARLLKKYSVTVFGIPDTGSTQGE